MNEIDQKFSQWLTENKRVAIATLVKVYGSAPQPLGSKMVVTEDGEFFGAVSGGCVEGDVIEQASRVIQTGQSKLKTYGISDDAAWEVGLACGGTIEVFIESSQPVHEDILQLQQQKVLFGVLTVLSGNRAGEKQIVLPAHLEDHPQPGLLAESDVFQTVSHALKVQKSEKMTAQLSGKSAELFCEIFSPPARLMIIGAVHIAMPLVELARLVSFSTFIIDPRRVFANRERFPSADHLVIGWPSEELEKLHIDENTFIVFVSHDEKFDVPALQVALKSNARYIGALGSKTTHAERVHKLIELGLTPQEIARIHAPIGLDIGAAGSQEIALAILTQMIAVKNGKQLPGKS